jgi:hypothetical protein
MVHAQLTKILGHVTDASTGEPVPFANVYLKGSALGTTTDFDGKYYFETMKPVDSITVTYVGYSDQTIAVRQNRYQEINFQLKPSLINLQEVVVYAGENPADILFKKIIKNKEQNTINNLEAWQYEMYTKIQFDANNFGERLKNWRLVKPFSFIFDYIDTSTVNGKVYLPVFITESLSDVYFSKNPDASLKKVTASRGSGIENPSIATLINSIKQEINIYDNYILLFDKQFVGPVANFGLVYYQYYLIDSAFIENQWCYKMAFKPRRKQELTFTGEFWVHDSTFAIRKIEMNIAHDANINFVNDLAIRQEYQFIDNKLWMLSHDYMVGDFNLIENTKSMPGFFGHRTVSYNKFVFNDKKEPQFYRSPTGIELDAESMKKSDEFWNENRHETLSKKEQGIYKMVDSIEHVPLYRTYTDVIYTGVYGYAPWKRLEFGPVARLYSFNAVEGSRIRIGVQTSTLFSKKIRFYGHLAYGSKDEMYKYKLGALYFFKKNPQRAMGLSYKYDIEQLSSSFNAFSQDNILATIFRKQPSDKLNLIKNLNFFYEHEILPGFSAKFNFDQQILLPAGDNKLQTHATDGTIVSHSTLSTSELGVNLRYAYHEKVVINSFDRTSFGSPFPVVTFNYSYGIPDLFGSEYDYHRLQLGVSDWFNVASFGWTKYILDAGKVFGKLPYPLLVLHPGNETFIFDEQAFNLVNYYEFISDQYVSLYATHHFDGFFLNKIPLLRKLKWREVVFAKGLIGSITKENVGYSVFPTVSHFVNKPYFEAGLGIENIFKIVRIDAVWRLSHLDNSNTHPFGAFISLHFDF